MSGTEITENKYPEKSNQAKIDPLKGEVKKRSRLLRFLRDEGEETKKDPSFTTVDIKNQETKKKKTAQHARDTAVRNRAIFEQLAKKRKQASSIQDDIEIGRKINKKIKDAPFAKDDITFEAVKQKELNRGIEEVLGYKFLESIGLVSTLLQGSSDEKTEESSELQKEVVTHNGSCGANSIAISFYIQVLEEQISHLDADYTKLVTSWNTTYPMKKVTNAAELFALLKEELKEGNTSDMEDILGPVIRVYIGISNKIDQEESPNLSEDKNRQWMKESLEKVNLNQVRENVGNICHEEEEEGYLDEEGNICSHKFYLDESDLEIITSELFNCNKVRASEVQMDVDRYRETDRKLKANEALIKKWGEENGQEVEINSRVQAYPGQIEASYREKNILVECYNVNMGSHEYAKWVEFQSLVQIEYANIEEKFDSFYDSINIGVMTKKACKDICEKIARRHIEEKLLIQIENGNGLITPQWNYHTSAGEIRPSIYIAHSNFVYWDVLIPKETLQKYSREHRSKGREYTLNPKHLEYLQYNGKEITPDVYGDATPYINLQSDEEYEALTRKRKEHESGSQYHLPSITALIKSAVSSLTLEKMLYIATLIITCLMTSVLTGCLIALTIALGNAYLSEKNDTEINQEDAKATRHSHSSTWQKTTPARDNPLFKKKTESFVPAVDIETEEQACRI